MILLDTNVVSELMRHAPDPHVVAWLDAQPPGEVWISAVTAAEIRLGIALLADGRRRTELATLAGEMLETDFAGQCLPFDLAAAGDYADIVAGRTRAGYPISVEDAQIAAIARSAGLTLATRNTKDFQRIPRLHVVNPWIAGV